MNASDVFCPKCKGIPKATYVAGGAFATHICYDSCGYIFWTLNVCPFCDDPSKTIILKKPSFGEKINCHNCNSTMYYFRCPVNDCGRLFYKTEIAYRMGEVNTCQQCQFKYKTLACPCGGQVRLSKDTIICEGQSAYQCQCCKKTLIYTICPSCHEPEYHLQPLNIGDRMRCSSCKTWRKYVPCPKCGRTLHSPKFSFYEPQHCGHCKIYFEYCKCPYSCSSVSFQVLTKQQGPNRKCYGCKKQYSVINCKRCQMSLYQENLMAPNYQATIDLCLNCKKEIQYYFCGCGLLSYDVACRNRSCPKPKKVVNMIELKNKEDEQKRKKDRSNQDPNFDEKQCKVCFDAESSMINEVCGHLAMCQQCTNGVLNGRLNNAAPCIICRAIGRYFKYKQPFYS